MKKQQTYHKPDIINFHVRQEIAYKIFESDYDRLGSFIQVTTEQYNELFEIEGGKMKPNIERDDELTAKIKEILGIE